MTTALKRLPKLFIVRHGETEWQVVTIRISTCILTCVGLSTTGTSEIPLTANGEAIIERLGSKAVGTGKFIDPVLLSKVLVSPRIRAQKTYQILFSNTDINPAVETEQLVREWTYGDYEGLHLHEIVEQRQTRGLQREHTDWNIWVDGCEGGESAQDLTNRADAVVDKVRKIHSEWIHEPGRTPDDKGGDVMVVSHGHFSRCLVTRWLGLSLASGGMFSLDPGGICVLEYSKGMNNTRLGAMNLGLL